LAQALWRLVSALIWFLIIPVIGKALRGNTESVAFARSTTEPFPWEKLFGSVLEFGLIVILVFYLNRWVQRRPNPLTIDNPAVVEPAPEYSLTGEPVALEEARAENRITS
jgi:large-conductance mechanosensitive channel